MVPEKLSLMLFKVDKNIPYDITVRRLEIVRLPDKQYGDMADVKLSWWLNLKILLIFLWFWAYFLWSIFSDILMGFWYWTHLKSN